MTILSAIGDITRFKHAKELVGYAGLGASVHDSGLTHRTGRITKQGRQELRTTLVEAAWSAVEYSPYWQAEFERLTRRLDQMKATPALRRAQRGARVVAVARKLLAVVWHVLTEQAADQHAAVKLVATKLMRWSMSSWLSPRRVIKAQARNDILRFLPAGFRCQPGSRQA